MELITKAWSRETFRSYRRTLTRLDHFIRENGEKEETLINPAEAPLLVSRCIGSLLGSYSEQVLKTMLGHMRKIIGIFDHHSGHGLLDLLSKAISRQAPTPSRRDDTMWNVDVLLAWIRKNWEEPARMKDSEVQTKAMLLTMMFSACRLAELGRMERPEIGEAHPESITLHTVTKQSQDTKRRIVIRRIATTALCPVSAILAWMERTAPREDGRLFHRWTDEEKLRRQGAKDELTTPAICTQFIKPMRAAGIPAHFTAYSVKHAVVTKLFRLGATEEQINAYGGWAQGSRTAQRWYNIATLEEDWLGTKLVGEWLGEDRDNTLEEFLQTYLPTTTTPEQATARASAMEALVAPGEEQEGSSEVAEEGDRE
jgi:site-specific recombinase XerD